VEESLSLATEVVGMARNFRATLASSGNRQMDLRCIQVQVPLRAVGAVFPSFLQALAVLCEFWFNHPRIRLCALTGGGGVKSLYCRE
jgi:hypothetical protein